MHKEKIREKTKGMDSQLEESDVRAASRTSGLQAGRPNNYDPEDLTAKSGRPEATPDRPNSSRTIRAISRTVRLMGRTSDLHDCLRAETGLRPLYPRLDPLAYKNRTSYEF